MRGALVYLVLGLHLSSAQRWIHSAAYDQARTLLADLREGEVCAICNARLPLIWLVLCSQIDAVILKNVPIGDVPPTPNTPSSGNPITPRQADMSLRHLSTFLGVIRGYQVCVHCRLNFA